MSRGGGVCTRAGVLGLLLVLVVGVGTMAQSPEPTPLFAPEDLAFTIPSQVGESELDIAAVDELDLTNREMWRDLLLPFGKEPGDVRQARAAAYLSGQVPHPVRTLVFGIDAMGIVGVPARDYAERFMDLAPQTVESFEAYRPLVRFQWRDIDGRDLHSTTLAPPEALVQWATEMAEERGVATEQQLADIRVCNSRTRIWVSISIRRARSCTSSHLRGSRRTPAPRHGGRRALPGGLLKANVPGRMAFPARARGHALP